MSRGSLQAAQRLGAHSADCRSAFALQFHVGHLDLVPELDVSPKNADEIDS